MTKFKKALIGTAAAGAMAVSANPAMANDYHGNHYKKDKIGAGEIIAGAVILGGLAAILSSNKKNDRYYHGSRGGHGYNNGYGYKTSYRRGGGRKAVKRCIRRAERYAGGKVTEIRDIDRTRYGYKIRGRIVVKDDYRGGRYDRRGHYDRRGNYNRRASYDRGRFTCYVENGRIADIRYRGLNNRRFSYKY